MRWYLAQLAVYEGHSSRLWEAGHGGHSHTDQYCYMEHTTHDNWNPGSLISFGDNRFYVRTVNVNCGTDPTPPCPGEEFSFSTNHNIYDVKPVDPANGSLGWVILDDLP